MRCCDEAPPGTALILAGLVMSTRVDASSWDQCLGRDATIWPVSGIG